MNEEGLTLLEILISTVILMLIVSGLVSLFVAGKKYITHSRSRMTAVELARKFVDPLQNQVNQIEIDYNSTCLNNGTCNNFNTNQEFSPIVYNSSVETTAVVGTSLRRAKITINWTEPN